MGTEIQTEQTLESVLDALVESYSGPEKINSLETYALPNRREVIRAYGHLQHLLFLGYFSTRRLEQQTLRLALAEHLLPASEIMCEQIQRAAKWEDRDKAREDRRPKGWCRDTVALMMAELPELRRILHGDITAAFENDPAAESIEEVVFSYPGVFAITAYRVAHVFYKYGVPMIPRILTEYAHNRTGIDIHPGATIGERFFIDHGTGVVIGATTQIGEDVKIYQGVTLGALSVHGDVPRDRETPTKRHPTLEDDVTVYAGSTILGGDMVVGQGVVIGGNVWLTRSVESGSKVYRRPNGEHEEQKK